MPRTLRLLLLRAKVSHCACPQNGFSHWHSKKVCCCCLQDPGSGASISGGQLPLPIFWQKRRHHRAPAATRINTCPPPPSFRKLLTPLWLVVSSKTKQMLIGLHSNPSIDFAVVLCHQLAIVFFSFSFGFYRIWPSPAPHHTLEWALRVSSELAEFCFPCWPCCCIIFPFAM